MNKYESHIFYLVEVGTSQRIEIKAVEPMLLENIIFSASGDGKFYIFVNKQRAATLFSGRYNRNAHYLHEITLHPEDTVIFEAENKDLSAQDMYVSYRKS